MPLGQRECKGAGNGKAPIPAGEPGPVPLRGLLEISASDLPAGAEDSKESELHKVGKGLFLV